MENFIGKRFGKLLVIADAEVKPDKDGTKRMAYLCLCDCKVEVVITRHRLQVPRGARSCGCLNTESRSALGLSKRKYPPHISSARQIFSNSYNDGDLLFEDFFVLTQLNCFYCNRPPSNSFNKFLHREKYSKNSKFAMDNGEFIYNGLDRVDSNKPHDLNNVVPCCYCCNLFKLGRTVAEFGKHIIEMHEFWAKKKEWDIKLPIIETPSIIPVIEKVFQ